MDARVIEWADAFTKDISMKALTTIAIAAAIATLSGCVVAPGRSDYRYRDHSYERRHDRDHYNDRYNDDDRRRDGDHAGGTVTRD